MGLVSFDSSLLLNARSPIPGPTSCSHISRPCSHTLQDLEGPAAAAPRQRRRHAMAFVVQVAGLLEYGPRRKILRELNPFFSARLVPKLEFQGAKRFVIVSVLRMLDLRLGSKIQVRPLLLAAPRPIPLAQLKCCLRHLWRQEVPPHVPPKPQRCVPLRGRWGFPPSPVRVPAGFCDAMLVPAHCQQTGLFVGRLRCKTQ
jgi:hypothetical protein